MEKSKVSLQVFNKMLIARIFLPLAYVAGWILLTLFILPVFGSSDFSIASNQSLFLGFFFASLFLMFSYFLILFLLTKLNNVRLTMIKKQILVIFVVSFAFWILELLAILTIYGMVVISNRVIYLGFFPFSIIFGFVGIALSSQVFIWWQKSFLYANKKRQSTIKNKK